MKKSEIKVGQRYVAQIPARVDRFVNEHLRDIVVTVEEVGVPYEVETYSASMVRGAGFTRTHDSERNDGVRVRWEAQEGYSKFTGRRGTYCQDGFGIITSRAIQRAIQD